MLALPPPLEAQTPLLRVRGKSGSRRNWQEGASVSPIHTCCNHAFFVGTTTLSQAEDLDSDDDVVMDALPSKLKELKNDAIDEVLTPITIETKQRRALVDTRENVSAVSFFL